MSGTREEASCRKKHNAFRKPTSVSLIRTIFIVPFRSLHNKYWSLKFENLNRRVELLLSVEVSRGVQGMQGMPGMPGMPRMSTI